MAGKYTLGDGAGLYASDSSGTERQVVGSTGNLISNGFPVNPIPVTESTAANAANSGVSLLPYSTSGGVQVTLNAPAAGVTKTLILWSSGVVPDSTNVPTTVYTGSTAIFITDGSTTATSKQKATFEPPLSVLNLLGVDANNWLVTSSVGGAALSS